MTPSEAQTWSRALRAAGWPATRRPGQLVAWHDPLGHVEHGMGTEEAWALHCRRAASGVTKAKKEKGRAR